MKLSLGLIINKSNNIQQTFESQLPDLYVYLVDEDGDKYVDEQGHYYVQE